MRNNVITFSSLDPSQKSAFHSIVHDPDNLHVVYGPPGTGKSQLIVSLLERLASDNKKVLFVSQNTEALRVIERMIKRTESTIDYPRSKNYVSLLDFCLMLYDSRHRTLKYLREQFSRVIDKQSGYGSLIHEPLSIQYPLQYTNLDHSGNYHITDDKVGFDELASYYLKYVNRPMAPESIRHFEKIDVRAIFTELDNYAQKDHFKEFNTPRRELALLSEKNDNILLPDVREQIEAINKLFQGDDLSRYAAKGAIDIVDYLTLLQKYNQIIEYLDLYRIATEHKDINELIESLKSFIEQYHKTNETLQRIDGSIDLLAKSAQYRVIIPDDITKLINLSSETIALADQSFDNLQQDYARIPALVKTIYGAAPNARYTSLTQLRASLARELGRTFTDIAGDIKDVFAPLTARDIGDLQNDLEEYYSHNQLKRRLHGVPKHFKELLGFDATAQMDTYRDQFVPVLDAIKTIIAIDGSTVGQFLDLASTEKTINLSKLGIQPSSDAAVIAQQLLPVYELCYIVHTKLGSDSITGDFDAINDWFKSLSYGVKTLTALRNDDNNKRAFLTANTADFITNANTAIEIKQKQQLKSHLLDEQKQLVQQSFLKNHTWLTNITEADSYVARAREVYEYLSKNATVINKVVATFSLPDDNAPTTIDLERSIALLNEVNQLDLFSDTFFEIGSAKTIHDWLGSINILAVYNNDAEIVEFIQHNHTIKNIRSALGESNRQYIDGILSNDITFSIFAARLVNVLVNESFGRATRSDRKTVTTKEIVDGYEKYLKHQKANAYIKDLKNIIAHSKLAMKELSKQSTLQLGGRSTMDKFRHNTITIADAFPIICATPKEVSKYLAARKGIFDYVIFDEASQLLPGQALPSIYRAKQAVIIGDPHQMPPSLNTSIGRIEEHEDEFDDLGESILDLVRKQPQKQHHLKVHYRSKYNKLFEPSREAIYSNDGIEPIFEAELSSGAPIDIVDDLGDEQDEFGFDKNFYTICESIRDCLRGDDDASFCVLFTTSKKLGEFNNFLAQVGEQQFKQISQLYGTEKILLSTVTNCQGIEGTFTIIYLQHYTVPAAMWFFNETAGAYKRLNVSITRQREGLKLLLADQRSRWIQTCEDKISSGLTGPNARKSAELMKSLLQNAGEATDMTYLDRKLGNNVNQFDSPLTQQLYEKLTNHYANSLGQSVKIYSEVGWNLLIPTGVAIGANERNVGFRIDLGIFSTTHKKFVLGIEMDGAMYHSGFDKEQSDYNRQKVLEKKGWELYRIWSTNWLNDTDHELNKLIRTIDEKLQ